MPVVRIQLALSGRLPAAPVKSSLHWTEKPGMAGTAAWASGESKARKARAEDMLAAVVVVYLLALQQTGGISVSRKTEDK